MRRAAKIPRLADWLSAFYELSGWLVGGVFSGGLRGFLFMMGAALPVAIVVMGHAQAVYILLAVLMIVAYVNARDISAARVHLERIAADPQAALPKLSEEQRTASAAVEALDAAARALHAATHGEFLTAITVGLSVERSHLDRRALRLLDAAIALGKHEVGDSREAASLAVVSLPTGIHPLDLQLGYLALREAWDDPERLSALHVGWRDKPTLTELSALARARADSLEGRRTEALNPDRALGLALHARAVGDEKLADQLLSATQATGAYR